MRSVVGLLLVGVALVGSAAPANVLDADHRLGQAATEPTSLVVRPRLLADLKPDGHCLRVRTVPVAQVGPQGGATRPGQRNLLLVPCPDLLGPEVPVRPWGDRPPLVIPVERGR